MSRVRIVLDETDSEQGSTWVVSVPLESNNEWGVWKAAEEAVRVFKMSVARDFEAVENALRQ